MGVNTNQEEREEKKAGGYTSGPETVKSNPGKGTRYEGPVAPVAASIVLMIGWAVFILLYAIYLSTEMTIFQNLIVTLVSLLIAGLLVGLIWVVYGPKDYWRGANN